MSIISKRRLKDEVSKQLFELPYLLLGKNRNPDEFQRLFTALFSLTEQTVFAKRIAVLYLLMKNIEYLIIQDVLKVSTSTISKCTMILENSNNLKNTLKDLVQDEKIGVIFQEILSDIYSPGTYGINWKNAVKRKAEFNRKKREGI